MAKLLERLIRTFEHRQLSPWGLAVAELAGFDFWNKKGERVLSPRYSSTIISLFTNKWDKMQNESKLTNLTLDAANKVILNAVNGLTLQGIKIRKDKTVLFGFGKIESSNHWRFKNNYTVSFGTFDAGWRVTSDGNIIIGKEDLEEEIQKEAVAKIVNRSLALCMIFQPGKNDVILNLTERFSIEFFSMGHDEISVFHGFYPTNMGIRYNQNSGWTTSTVGPK